MLGWTWFNELFNDIGQFIQFIACYDKSIHELVDWPFQTTGMLVDLPQGVYCIDNDRQGSHPRIAIGSNRFIYRLRSEKRN